MCCRPSSQITRGTYRDTSVATPKPHCHFPRAGRRRPLSLLRCGYAGGEVIEEGRTSFRPIHLAWRVAADQLCMADTTLASTLTRSSLEEATHHTRRIKGVKGLRAYTVRVDLVDWVRLRLPIFTAPNALPHRDMFLIRCNLN